jgi:hypothetical protein
MDIACTKIQINTMQLMSGVASNSLDDTSKCTFLLSHVRRANGQQNDHMPCRPPQLIAGSCKFAAPADSHYQHRSSRCVGRFCGRLRHNSTHAVSYLSRTLSRVAVETAEFCELATHGSNTPSLAHGLKQISLLCYNHWQVLFRIH